MMTETEQVQQKARQVQQLTPSWEATPGAVEELEKQGFFYPENVHCWYMGRMWRCEFNWGMVGQTYKIKIFPSLDGPVKITTIEGKDIFSGPMLIKAAPTFDGKQTILQCYTRKYPSGDDIMHCDSILPDDKGKPVMVQSPAKKIDVKKSVLTFSDKDIVQCYGASDKKFTCFVEKGSKDVQSGKKRYDMVSCGGECSSISAFSKAGPGTMFTTSVPGSTGKCSEVVKDGKDVLACMVTRG